MEAPYVMLTSPNNGDTDIEPTAPIKVWFNHDLNPGTVTAATLMLFDITNSVVVSGTVEYSQKVMTFIPNQPLSLSTQYQIVIIGGDVGIKDVFGSTMMQNYQVVFFTAGSTLVATPLITIPADRTLISQPFTVAWTGSQAPYDVQIALDAAFQSIYWPVSGDDLSVVQASEDGGSLIPGRTFADGFYYVRVRSEGGAWSGTIGFAVSALLPSTPIGPLNLVVASPSPFAANQDVTQLQLTFDRPINALSANTGVYIVQVPL